MQAEKKPSLYDRLGGVYSIATVVDDLIDRLMVDPRLNANPLVAEAHHRVPPAGFKFLDYRSLNIYTMMVSSILYFQRNTTGAALISSKYW